MANDNDEVLSANSNNLVDQLYFGTAEKTLQESSMDPASQLKPFNADDIYQKDNTYGIYDDMLKDDQIEVALRIKKDLVLSSGWDIVCKNEDVKADLEKALNEDTESSFDAQLEEILSAYEYGFSLTEKIFKKRPDGTLTLKTLKTRHPASWIIETDNQGNLEKYSQVDLASENIIDPKSLIHYINNPKFQNPYGTSDLRAAYNAWFIKRQITRYYAIFLEKSASPIPVARYDSQAPSSMPAQLLTVLKKFQQKTALVIPKELEVEFLTHGNTGEAYIKGINLFNMFIGRALFVPDLMGFQGSETSGGSFSLGQQQFQLYAKHIQKRRKLVEDIVNKHIIKSITVHNFGFLEEMPVFKLKPIEDDDALAAAKVWLEAIKGKAYKPNPEEINHFRGIVKFPEGDVVEASPEPVSNPGGAFGSNEDTTLLPNDIDKMQAFAKGNPFAEPSGDFHKKVDFKQVARSLDSNMDLIKAEAQPLIEAIYEDLFDQLEKKKILKTGNIERLETLKLRKLKDLKLLLKKGLKKQYLDGKQLAQTELFKSDFAAPIVDEQFLKILEAEVFQFIGDWEFKVTQKARVEMIAAIKDGRPISSVIDIISTEGKKDSAVALERFARTKTTEVLNKGRVAFFEDSGVVSGYQYSAILDDRTTEICRGLHGKKFKAGTEPIPPMHFNCRSVLIPITKFEEFKPDKGVGKRNIDEFIEAEKGKGFSKQ